MDYEKKYNDALNLAKSYYGNGCNEFLDTIFPELSESEDEKIRKSIIATIEQCPDDFLNPKNRDRMLAWLERQKEPENTSASTMAPSCWEVERKEQKPEWSEEDKKKISELKTFIALCKGFNKANRQKAFNMIDALRPPQYCEDCKLKRSVENWKPSEEQMEAMESAVKLYKDTHFEIFHERIVSLYEQLKKLI